MAILVSDKKLFTIVLYSAFINNEYLISMRDIWKNPLVTGAAAASALGIAGWLISPIILSAIIHALGFGTGGIAANSFGSWFMSLYGGIIGRGSFLSVLQSIGAAGFGTIGTYLSGVIGAAIGILIGVLGGPKLADYFNEMKLIESEQQMFDNLVQIEENNNTVIFTLMPTLLNNDLMLKCFIETFIICSSFANSKLFEFNLEYDLLTLKSEGERVNNIVNNLLISSYEESRMKFISDVKHYVLVYKLDLSDYEPSNLIISLLVEIWRHINKDVSDINKDVSVDKNTKIEL